MIGYYVHHHGSGHRHRAVEVARVLTGRGEVVVGLSSLQRPAGWAGEWVRLAEDAGDEGGVVDPGSTTAGGRLHWVPHGHTGLRSRMAAVSAWLEEARPAAVVVDVSVEVALLVRLHGVGVVTLVQPGCRDDPAHRLGYDVADALVACWPASATGMLTGLPDDVVARVHTVGGLSRFPPASPAVRRPGGRRVALLSGTGGEVDADALAAARDQTPEWTWTVLDRRLGTWADDPSVVLADSDVVVTHAGQNALAEVAAARRPAVVVPQPRPHDEQLTTASVLAAGSWPALVADRLGGDGWGELLHRAAALDGGGWVPWCDGLAAERFADVVLGVR